MAEAMDEAALRYWRKATAEGTTSENTARLLATLDQRDARISELEAAILHEVLRALPTRLNIAEGTIAEQAEEIARLKAELGGNSDHGDQVT